MKATRIIIQAVLIAAVIGLSYMVYETIMDPVRFDREKTTRREAVITRLKDIRELQNSFYNVYGRYTANFDSLIAFAKEGKLPIVKLTADPRDTTFSHPIRDTVGYVLVKDTLFKDRSDFNADQLQYIPFSNIDGAQSVKFTMTAGKIVKGNVPVNVVEVFAPNKEFLKGLNLKKYNVKEDEGLGFGSMFEPTTDGNWE